MDDARPIHETIELLASLDDTLADYQIGMDHIREMMRPIEEKRRELRLELLQSMLDQNVLAAHGGGFRAGVTTKHALVITNLADVRRHLEEHGLLLQYVKIDEDKLKKLIESGVKVPGADMVDKPELRMTPEKKS